MPELPEVETVRRGLAPAMEGKRIERAEIRRPDLRFPFPENFVQRITGARVTAMRRRAKYLVGELSTGDALIVHLGMTGRFTISHGKKDRKIGEFVHEAGDDPKHDHMVFDMSGGVRVTFNDARRFGFVELWPLAELDTYPAFAELGPEPISNQFSGAFLKEVFAGKKTPVKSALLDQHVVAGIGNIYACEALFRAGIDPRKHAGALRGPRLEKLAHAVREVIEEAIEAGGSTISDFAHANGELGYFQHRFCVYDKEGDPCPKCGKPIKRLVQSGRSTFWCSHDQT